MVDFGKIFRKGKNAVVYFEAQRPDREGRCSDNSCPCGQEGVIIPKGEGYLYISKEVVEFRHDARSIEECREKCLKIRAKMGSFIIWTQGTISPILCCEQAARLRGLDLKIAAADAKYWWETGLAPLRATPLCSAQE